MLPLPSKKMFAGFLPSLFSKEGEHIRKGNEGEEEDGLSLWLNEKLEIDRLRKLRDREARMRLQKRSQLIEQAKQKAEATHFERLRILKAKGTAEERLKVIAEETERFNDLLKEGKEAGKQHHIEQRRIEEEIIALALRRSLAAKRLQSCMRGFRLRNSVAYQKKKRAAAAKLLQSVWRRQLSRNLLKNMLEASRAATAAKATEKKQIDFRKLCSFLKPYGLSDVVTIKVLKQLSLSNAREIVSADDEQLRKAGLSKLKVTKLRSLCERSVQYDVNIDAAK